MLVVVGEEDVGRVNAVMFTMSTHTQGEDSCSTNILEGAISESYYTTPWII